MVSPGRSMNTKVTTRSNTPVFLKTAVREPHTVTITNYREFLLINDGLSVRGNETYGRVIPFN